MHADAITAEHRNGLEGLGAASLFHRPQLSGGILLSHHPRRQVTGQRRHPVGNLFQRQAQGFQPLHRHINTDLLLRQAPERHPVDAPVQQFILKPVHELAQLGPVDITVNQQPGHRFVPFYPGHLRFFGIRRQVVELVHLLAHVVHCLYRVGAFMEFQGNGRHPLRRRGGHLLEAVDAAQTLLQRVGNAALHILGRRTTPHHPHADHIQGESREELDIHAAQGHYATEQHHQHHQIAG